VSRAFAAGRAQPAAGAVRCVLDPKVFLEILTKGGGDGVVLNRLRPYIESRDSSGFRFTIANALKDMTYYTTMAQETGAMHETAESVRRTYAQALQGGPEQSTVPELITLLAKAQPALGA
jgi:3-hydroxyisobutyrate dehydrogenase